MNQYNCRDRKPATGELSSFILQNSAFELSTRVYARFRLSVGFRQIFFECHPIDIRIMFSWIPAVSTGEE
jgi:hypothetical protein